MVKILMYDSKPYDKESFEKFINENYEITYLESKLDESTVDLSKGYDCVVTFVNDNLNSNVIKKLYNNGIKLIATRCAGFNNVDIKEAFNKIHVVRVPAYSPYAIAEFTMGMLLTINRRIHKAYNRTREYNFSIAGLTGMDLHGKTIGIIGLGKIGKIFAEICNGFGMKILAYDKYPSQNSNVEFVELDELFEKSDIISLHCPLFDENYHLINKENIEKMKKGVIILNTSRGALINAEDLLDAIKSRKVSAACLDVYEEETELFFEDKSGHILDDDILARLISMPNIILTSHQAYLTTEALENIAQTTVENIRQFFNDEKLENEICYHCGLQNDCKKQRKGKCF